jgi:hypothetical protein
MSAGTSCDPNPCPHGGNYCGKERTWEERVDLVRQVQNARAGMETPFALETGRGSGALQDDGTRDACGTFLLNTDQSYENGYAWSYGGVAPPYYGAFAEGYVYPSGVACSVILDLTQIGYAAGQTLDAYAWADAAGYPGAVVNVSTGRNPGPIAFWPNLSRHVFPLAFQGVVSDLTWVGYWGNWPGAHAGWFVGADLDGFGGCPVTNIAPGIGYPTGWNNVSIIWGPTQAIGCGGEFIPGGPTVVRQSSWGEIKALFR